jgi:hypothetical protein
MRTAGSQNDETPLQRFQNAARQLKHSKAFIATVWNLEGQTPAFAEFSESEPVGTGSGYENITVHEKSSNTGEENYDQDITLDETLFNDDDDDDIVVAMSSEDEGPAFPAGFDPNPNKIH